MTGVAPPSNCSTVRLQSLDDVQIFTLLVGGLFLMLIAFYFCHGLAWLDDRCLQKPLDHCPPSTGQGRK